MSATITERNNKTNVLSHYDFCTQEVVVHFSLSCAEQDAIRQLVALRDAAEYSFDRVSRIFRLYQDECLADGASDPLIDLKLRAQSFVIYKKEFKTIAPVEIAGFAAELRNDNMAYFGFAKYPEKMQFQDETVTLHQNSQMHWRSFAKLGNKGEFKHNVDFTVRSFTHFLQVASNLGVLRNYKIY